MVVRKNMASNYGVFGSGDTIQSAWGNDINDTLDDAISKSDASAQSITSALSISGAVTISSLSPAAGNRAVGLNASTKVMEIISTSDLAEGTSLYFTNTRAQAGQTNDFDLSIAEFEESIASTGGVGNQVVNASGTDTGETYYQIERGDGPPQPRIRSKETFTPPQSRTKLQVEIVAVLTSIANSAQADLWTSTNGGAATQRQVVNTGWTANVIRKVTFNELTFGSNDRIRIFIGTNSNGTGQYLRIYSVKLKWNP